MTIEKGEDSRFLCPLNIAVIGGGRWSRILAQELYSIVPAFVRISIHSLHNARAMSAWASARGLENRIQVSSSLPDFSSLESKAVIVSNAACDHEKAIEWALSNEAAVLVEKPLTLSLVASQRLADLALRNATYIAAAHVFLFAGYVEEFSKIISKKGVINQISVNWMDPISERRYGEDKSYDPGLPVFADWLPHVISILGALTASQSQKCVGLEFLRGGSHLNIELMLDEIPCAIQLIRNGNRRQRIIEVTTENSMVALDFSCEPGIIISNNSTRPSDPDWNFKRKPVSSMLLSFLNGAAGGVRDSRLDISIGLRSSEIIDQVLPLYQSARFAWLSKALSEIQDGNDRDLRYVLSEILQEENPHSIISIDRRVDNVCRNIKEAVLRAGMSFNEPENFFNIILKKNYL